MQDSIEEGGFIQTKHGTSGRPNLNLLYFLFPNIP